MAFEYTSFHIDCTLSLVTARYLRRPICIDIELFNKSFPLIARLLFILCGQQQCSGINMNQFAMCHICIAVEGYP